MNHKFTAIILAVAMTIPLFGPGVLAAENRKMDLLVPEEMEFETCADIPLEGDYHFDITSDGNKTVLTDDFDSVEDAAAPAVLGIQEQGYLTLIRKGAAADGFFKKFLATDNSRKGEMTLEIGYELIGTPWIYFQLEGYANWRGAMTFEHKPSNDFFAYGNNTKALAKPDNGQYVLRIDFHYNAETPAKSTMDVYMNDTPLYTGIAYRGTTDQNYVNNYDIGKIAIKLKKESAVGTGMKVDYIRLSEAGEIIEPTQEPTEEPTQQPTDSPTQEPTEAPTETPTQEPTAPPTQEPTPFPVTKIPGTLYYQAGAQLGEAGYIHGKGEENEPSYTDYGIIMGSDVWGYNDNDMNGFRKVFGNDKYAIRLFSPSKANAGTSPKTYAQFDFTKDTVYGPYNFDSQEGIYVLETEFSILMRPQNGNDGYLYYILKGKNAAGTDCEIARLVISLTSANGKLGGEAYMGNAENSARVAYLPYIQIGKEQLPAILSYLKVKIDFQNSTYSAWLVKRGDQNGYAPTEASEEHLLVADAPFVSPAKVFTGIDVQEQNNYQGDRFDFTFMKVSELSAADVLAEAKAAMTESVILGGNSNLQSVTENLNLPARFRNAEVTWKSSDTSVVREDGTVIRPGISAPDQTVTLTAVLSRGGKTEKAFFHVTVSSMKNGDVVIPVPTPEPDEIELLEGEIVNESMGYTSKDEIELSTDFGYNLDQDTDASNKSELVEDVYTQTNRTDVGAVIGVNGDGNLVILKTGNSNMGGHIKKYLSDSAANTGKHTLEIDYELIGNPSIYWQVEGFSSWRGAITMVQSGSTLAPYGVSAKAFPQQGTMTMDFDYGGKKLRIYGNNDCVFEAVNYRSDGSGYYDLGKIRFMLQKSSPKGSGIIIKGIRLVNTDKYMEVHALKDKQEADKKLPGTMELTNGAKLEFLRTTASAPSVNNNVITWESSDPSIIDPETGLVTADQDEAKNVRLTMKVYNLLRKESLSFDYDYTVESVNLPNIQYLVRDNIPAGIVDVQDAGGSVTVSGDTITLVKNQAGAVSAKVYYDLGEDFPVSAKTTTEFDADGSGRIMFVTLNNDKQLTAVNITSLQNGVVSQATGAHTAETAGNQLVYQIWPEAGTVSSTVDGKSVLSAAKASEAVGNLAYVVFEIPESAGTGTLTVSGVRIYTDIYKFRDMFNNGISLEKVANGNNILQDKVYLPKEFAGQPVRWTSTSTRIDIAAGTVEPMTQYGHEDVSLTAAVEIGGQTFQKTIDGLAIVGVDEASLAYRKKVTSSIRAADGTDAANLTDGTSYYKFTSAGGEQSFYTIIDLGSKQWFSQVMIDEESSAISGYQIYVSDDELDWEQVAQGTVCGKEKLSAFKAVNKRYIKIEFQKTERIPVTICELSVYNNMTDENRVRLDRDAIQLPKTISGDIAFPVLGTWGSEITWTSSHPEIISSAGKFTRPAKTTVVTLTAKVSYHAAAETQSFVFTVTGSGSGGGNGGGGGSSSGSTSGGNANIMVPLPNTTPDNNIKEDKASLFSDIDSVDWAKNSINALAESGIISGFDGKYRPNDLATKEEFVKIVAAAFGFTASGGETAFEDVDPAAWYAPYVAAARENNIVSGLGDGRFGIGTNITRQDMAVIIANAMKASGKEKQKIRSYAGFLDEASMRDYARDSIIYLYERGILSGDSSGNFRPIENATRAEIAVVIHSVIE